MMEKVFYYYRQWRFKCPLCWGERNDYRHPSISCPNNYTYRSTVDVYVKSYRENVAQYTVCTDCNLPVSYCGRWDTVYEEGRACKKPRKNDPCPNKDRPLFRVYFELVFALMQRGTEYRQQTQLCQKVRINEEDVIGLIEEFHRVATAVDELIIKNENLYRFYIIRDADGYRERYHSIIDAVSNVRETVQYGTWEDDVFNGIYEPLLEQMIGEVVDSFEELVLRNDKYSCGKFEENIESLRTIVCELEQEFCIQHEVDTDYDVTSNVDAMVSIIDQIYRMLGRAKEEARI